ncbi:hypothetical protein B0T18DRAFT_391984 [Schizothecium vesticola]|uniref:Uncharacterized protein n=1 Tax=Schizothecium vesticola TaxID=314040 RepID=A0AA40EPK7_9PEZI|nr:hypothetical protein B0T18DRAFT_391984 [Schizothecium vesticola]
MAKAVVLRDAQPSSSTARRAHFKNGVEGDSAHSVLTKSTCFCSGMAAEMNGGPVPGRDCRDCQLASGSRRAPFLCPDAPKGLYLPAVQGVARQRIGAKRDAAQQRHPSAGGHLLHSAPLAALGVGILIAIKKIWIPMVAHQFSASSLPPSVHPDSGSPNCGSPAPRRSSSCQQGRMQPPFADLIRARGRRWREAPGAPVDEGLKGRSDQALASGN